MGITEFLYLANLADNIRFLCAGFLILATIFVFVAIPICDIENCMPEYLSFIKKYMWTYLIAILLLMFSPSEKTLYLMIGADYFQKSDIPPKIEAALEKKLDEYLAPEVKK